MSRLPFKQKIFNGLLIREFNKDVDPKELIWHMDKLNRKVRVVEGSGWLLQIEDKLPSLMEIGKSYFIPKNTYHRIIKGKSNLVLEIREEKTIKRIKMKVTKRQLRRIIKEEKEKIIKEFFNFGAAQREMMPHAEAMGRLLAGRPDVAAKIRDALSDGAPFSDAGKALYDAYKKAQNLADAEYSLTAGYDD